MDARRSHGRRIQARRGRAPFALLIVVSGLLVPGDAGAATLVTNTGQGLYTFLPAAGEANTLVIDGDATNYTFTDSVPITDNNSGGACTQLTPSSLRCPRVVDATAMNRVRADLAFPPLFNPDNAPNTFRYNGVPPPGTASEPGLRVESALTDSNDDIVGSSGNDLIRSYGGVDTVSGGDGNDVIGATPPEYPPSSTFSGGNGNDEIDANGATAASISGGEGDDLLTDAGTLLGEGGADKLTNHGDYGGLVGDLLDGGAGNDALVELPDSMDCPYTVADVNIGGSGQDTVYDDCGVNDVFKLKDGEPDKWHCGDFTGKAELDPSDVLVAPKLLCARGPDVLIKFPKIKKDTARFKPVTDNKAAVIECRLDKKRFKKCPSPVRYKNLKDGKHIFQARAVAGSLIGKVAKYRWTVR